MLTSSTSHSPALNPSSSASSTTFGPCASSNASYRPSQSPRQTPRQPPPSFAKRAPASPKLAKSASLRSPAAPSPPRKTADAATQYSPPTKSSRPRSPHHATSVDPSAPSSKAEGKGKRSSIESIDSPVVPKLKSQIPLLDGDFQAYTQLTVDSQPLSNASSSKRARPPRPAIKIMPARYELCDVKDLVTLISNMLMELVQFNDGIPLRDGRLTRFHSRAPPGISVSDYLQRLTTHATLSPPILLSMVYYIDRLCALYPAFTISSLTVHRFLITAATVASKGLSDSFWTNSTYARVGGVSLRELALLELEFLWRVHWRIVPKPEVLVDYYRSLVERCEGYEIGTDADAVATTDDVLGVIQSLSPLFKERERQIEIDNAQ
ncbi:hypothetical protein FGG08_003681 [Glutinoglossum americanum]|uniref:Cyclin-dependent protein kinase regulator Pho80 n=1 Tax=Glutinoglossum americanum TaxID=1670608 RepID=A0A9P8I6M1_9PEZI|nr:hypothetical protein FGG08_003681 [Glutinoglossum americanum]